MNRSRQRGYAAHCLALALSCAACGDDGQNAGNADAGGSGAHAHAGSGGRADGSSGHGAGSGGSLGSGGNGGASGRDLVCPPCVAPPAPGCIGSGPCGCGPYTCPEDSGAADAGTADAGAADAGACPAFGDTFVATLKGCKVDDDCQVIQQQLDCCGTYAAMGIAKVSSARFFECAPAASSFPLCGCASRPTQADDGRSNANFDLSDVGVRCDEGACSSYVKTRACGTMSLTCSDGQLCVGYQTTNGPSTDVEYKCSPNPCSDKLDCECARGLCDLRSDRQRTCGLDFMADVFCFDPSQ